MNTENKIETPKYAQKDIGIKVIGQVINSKVVGGTTKEGKTWANTETMILCNSEVVRIVEKHKEGKPIPKQSLNNEIVSVNLFAGFKDNGVLILNGAVE